MDRIRIDYLFKLPMFYTGIVELVREDDESLIRCLWYRDGVLHREGAPAIIYTDGTVEWWFDGERHREDGPAIDWPVTFAEWWLDGELIYNNNWMYPSPSMPNENHGYHKHSYIVIEEGIVGKGTFNGAQIKFNKILAQAGVGYIPILPGMNK